MADEPGLAIAISTGTVVGPWSAWASYECDSYVLGLCLMTHASVIVKQYNFDGRKPNRQ